MSSRPHSLMRVRLFSGRNALICCLLVTVLIATILLGVGVSQDRAEDPTGKARVIDTPVDNHVILISIDGFRADFWDRFEHPYLSYMAGRGVRVKQMRPVFPSKTFPNHWSIITGLLPETHGIVGNAFYAPDLGLNFSVKASGSNGLFWGGMPLWSAAQLQNVTSGCVFWPGSELPGTPERPAPAIALKYNGSLPNDARALEAVRLVKQGTRFVTLYFSLVDETGHKFGVDGDAASAALQAAITSVDSAIRLLYTELRKADIDPEVVVVADHGMVSVSTERSISVESLLATVSVPYMIVDIREPGDVAPLLSLYLTGNVTADAARAVAAQLHHEHARFFARDDIPEQFRFRHNVRIPHVLGVADMAWVFKRDGQSKWPTLGTHGYNNSALEMQALCLAAGPTFQSNVTIDSCDNIDLVNMLSKLLGITAPPNNGSATLGDRMLRSNRFHFANITTAAASPSPPTQ
jgi:predicted AlkP superfamily pyrophosphatase or phosphodiesterase